MISQAPRVAVSGASGYLGSRICETLESHGWDVIRLVRDPNPSDRRSRYFDLEKDVPHQSLESVDLLIHGAYDLSLTRPSDIWRVNVEGTRRLLSAARGAGVRRLIVLSSMSAYEGTTQLYGRSKLEIERLATQYGGCSIRPGLVYAKEPRGMMGALNKIAGMWVVPVPSGDPRQYPVHEDDLMAVIARLSEVDALPSEPIGVAQATPVALRDLLRVLAARQGRPGHLVTVPWQALYWALRLAELAPLRMPFRADSLLGLVHPAPFVPSRELLSALGISLRGFELSAADGS